MEFKVFGLPISMEQIEIDLLTQFKEELIENGQKFELNVVGKEGKFKIALLLLNKKPENTQNNAALGDFKIIDYPKVNSSNDDALINLKISISNAASKYVKQSNDINYVQIVLLHDKNFDDLEIKGMQNRPASASLEESEEEFADFIVQDPKFTLDQMVLNEELEQEIKTALVAISQTHKIYYEWGFDEIDQIPKAILNFYGPPGTGKTMAANAIANYNNSKILALNYSEIESKYVGDAPKKLMKAFEAANRENAVLFFDEADSFLGKRITNISSSSDQAINSLRSQLLILLENFEGIVIFATNLVSNYDPAFESRILKHLKFELPDARLRLNLIKKMIPTKLPLNKPLSEEEFEELVELSEGLSGRQIKNAILDTLTTAAFNNEDLVGYKYFKSAFENMKSKSEKMAQENIKPALPNAVKEALQEKIKANLNITADTSLKPSVSDENNELVSVES